MSIITRRRGIRHITPAGSNVFTPVDGTYALTFDDEFNGSAIDTTKWFVANNTSGGTNNANSLPANVVVSGGILSLNMTGTFSSWRGAWIHTGDSTTPKFTVNGGGANAAYIEARIRLPSNNQQGLWPAFWLNDNATTPAEMDIVEFLGQWPTSNPVTVYNQSDGEVWHQGPEPGAAVSGVDYGVNLGDAYHVYGLHWSSAFYKFYTDGVLVRTITAGQASNFGSARTVQIVNKGLGIHLNTGANGYGGVNNMTASTTFPSVVKVGYVHVYQVGGAAVTPQANYGGPGDTSGPTS